jgi:alkanesulfonate monooxygenase SsuD/methylene tetrahydromethanopterin reductase-like flavin-dependent oxidoreductase (luciferase family)
MGARDFHPISANFLLSKWLRSHWDNYAKGKASAGAVAKPDEWRVARTIFVADDSVTARSYGGDDPNSPYRFYYRQIMSKFKLSGRLAAFKESPDLPDSTVSEDGVIDNLVLRGTVNEVVDRILALREEVGDFGEIVYAGMDWVDPALTKRSMVLMAEEVMPRVNAALGKPRQSAPAAALVS